MNGENKNTKIIIVIVSVIVIGFIIWGTLATYFIFKHSLLAVGSVYDKASNLISDVAEKLDDEIEEEGRFPSNSLEKPESYVNVEFGKMIIEKGEYGFINSELEVKVTNVSDKMKSFHIEIEAVDPEDGSRIGTDYIFATDLKPGQFQTFRAFEFISSADAEKFENAEFKILKVNAYNS